MLINRSENSCCACMVTVLFFPMLVEILKQGPLLGCSQVGVVEVKLVGHNGGAEVAQFRRDQMRFLNWSLVERFLSSWNSHINCQAWGQVGVVLGEGRKVFNWNFFFSNNLFISYMPCGPESAQKNPTHLRTGFSSVPRIWRNRWKFRKTSLTMLSRQLAMTRICSKNAP